MTRYNHASGRTMSAWVRKCDNKRAWAQTLADQLGGDVVGIVAGGPGVPGNLENRFDIQLPDGEQITMKQARNRLGH